MRIAIAHNALTDESLPDEEDVILQVEAVYESLRSLHHESIVLPCGLNLAAVEEQLRQFQPDAVFNLVESLNGKGRLISFIPSLLDVMGIPYTGSASDSITLTSNKVMAKQRMVAAGLPTPAWIGPYPVDLFSVYETNWDNHWKGIPWIVKSVWEHASLGISGNELLQTENLDELIAVMRSRAPKLGGLCFAEKYVDGREFNLSILATAKGPEVLPPAEIIFEGYHPTKPRIVCYDAKWNKDSFEYSHTPRRFDFPPEDTSLIQTLKQRAIDCWNLFGLSGYARVDFRVDREGKAWILEVNANPCLSPDAGFAAAVERAGIPFAKVIDCILSDALGKKEPCVTVHPIMESPSPASGISTGSEFRYDPCPKDMEEIRKLVEVTDVFRPSEIDVAVELVEERLSKGTESGYFFVFYEDGDQLLGYSCYGQIPCTETSYDIYWIAVSPDYQRKGLGKKILVETERLIQSAGGKRIYIDTSQSAKYDNTREFYGNCGYATSCVLEDFYAPGDGKTILCKPL